jgi:hypothetical protein
MLFGLGLVAQLALGAASSGADCTLPKVRDAQPLRKAVQEDGNLSIAIDAVATACFDSEGEWNAGIATGKRAKNALGPECKKAIQGCDLANAARTRSAAAHLLDAAASADMDRPFSGAKYAPQRTSPPTAEVAADAVNCKSQKRSELFGMAQRRSDLSKAHAQTLSDYARYRAWLELARQQCRDGLNAPTTSVDASKDAAASASAADAGASPSAAAAPVSEERRVALAGPLPEKWRYLSGEAQKIDVDPEAREYFLPSKEVKGCVCPRPNAAALARALEKKEGGETGMALITADDAANTRCALCFLDAYAGWKARVTGQCSAMNDKSEYELNRLEQSEDGPSIPRACFDRARDARAAAQKLAMPPPPGTGPTAASGSTGRPVVAAGASDAGAASARGGSYAAGPGLDGGPQKTFAGPGPVGATGTGGYAGASTGSPGTGAYAGNGTGGAGSGAGPAGATGSTAGGLTTVNGMTYYRPPTPAAGPNPGAVITGPSPGYRAPTGPGSPDRPAPQYDSFVAPQSYAPIPAREEGRMYVRVSMSSACVAELTPGPIQARNGDLILVPFGAPTLDVKSPCGGVVEIYYGKEPTPRFSEIFGRNQPVSFVFKPQ